MWEFNCSELADWYGNAPIYDGLESVNFDPADTRIDGDNDLKEGAKYFVKGTARSWMLAKTTAGPILREITGVVSTTVSYSAANANGILVPRAEDVPRERIGGDDLVTSLLAGQAALQLMLIR